MRHKGRELAVKEGLRNRTTRALNARPLGVNQGRLHIRVATAVAHVRDGRKGPGLDVKGAPLTALLRCVIAQTAVRVDRAVVVSKALTAKQGRIDVLNGRGGGLFGNKVGHLVFAGASRITIVLSDLALVIIGAGELIDAELARGDRNTARERGYRHTSIPGGWKKARRGADRYQKIEWRAEPCLNGTLPYGLIAEQTMIFRNMYDARVVSVQDYDVVLPVHSVYHPVCKTAARRRLIKAYPEYKKAIAQAFDNKAFKSSWGILIEDAGQPVCVFQNLSCVVKNMSFRRLLRINVNDTYPPVHNIPTNAGSDLATSRRIVL